MINGGLQSQPVELTETVTGNVAAKVGTVFRNTLATLPANAAVTIMRAIIHAYLQKAQEPSFFQRTVD